jgi:AraC-like DNA-binding protein
MVDARSRDARLARIAREFSRTHAALARNADESAALRAKMARLCEKIGDAIDQSRGGIDRTSTGDEAPSRCSSRAARRRPERKHFGLPRARLRKVLDYIDASLAERLGVATLAEVAGMSPGHFATMFKQTTGLTPHEAVLRRRLARAQELLADESLTIASIGSQLGFSSQAHFATVFRRRVGVPPNLWRAERRQRRTAAHNRSGHSSISTDTESGPQESESQRHPLRALMEAATEPPHRTDTAGSHPGTAWPGL